MNHPKASRTIALLALATSVLAVAACGRRGSDAALPPFESIVLESPADDGGASQALCASDTAAYDDLRARIETYNDAIQARIALIQLAVKATRRDLAKDGEAEFSAERDGYTLTFHVTEDAEGNLVYDATLTSSDGTELRLLTGTAVRGDDGTLVSGSWDVFRARDDRAVQVVWTQDGGVLTADRTATGAFGTRESHYVRDDTTVTIDFTGPNQAAAVEWDRTTKDGSITIDGVTRCWDASDDLTDFCSADCPAG